MVLAGTTKKNLRRRFSEPVRKVGESPREIKIPAASRYSKRNVNREHYEDTVEEEEMEEVW